jgi:hypothetical protein
MKAVMMYEKGNRNLSLLRSLHDRFNEIIEVQFDLHLSAEPIFTGEKRGMDFDWRAIEAANMIAYPKHLTCLGRRDTMSLLWSLHRSGGHRMPASKLWCATLEIDAVQENKYGEALDSFGFIKTDSKQNVQDQVAFA